MERAVELDPVSPIISANLATALWAAGQTEEAIEQMRKTTDLAPRWWNGWFDPSRALLETRSSLERRV